MTKRDPGGHYEACPELATPPGRCRCAGITAAAEAYHAEEDDRFAQELSWNNPLDDRS